MKIHLSVFLKAFLFCCFSAPFLLFSQAFSVTVNTTDDIDDGRCTTNHCSYREALNLANGFQGEMFIFFNIPGSTGSTRRIEVTGNLTPISNFGSLTIDGSSQPNGSVVIDGNGNVDYGLELISAGSTVIDGLTYDNFRLAGIQIGSNSNDCVIGTTKSGNTFRNSRFGVVIQGNRALIRNNIFDNNDINGVFVTGTGSATVGEENNPSAGNTFLNHRFAGVEADERSDYVAIFRNSFYCNEEGGITNFNFSNNNIEPPTITEASTTQIKGTADIGALVQVYVFDPNQTICKEVNSCQGNIYLGAVIPDRTGTWEINEQSFAIPMLPSYQVTATQTETGFDDAGNFFRKHTSEFAACFALCDTYTLQLSSTGPACPGDKFEISVTATSPSNNPEPLSYSWTGPGGAFAGTGATIVVTETGTYTVFAKNSCNEFEESITVNAQETPPASITASYNGPICEFDTLQLFATTEKVIYEWSGPFGFTSNDRNPVVNLGASSLRSGLYFLSTKTPENGCPGPKDTVEVLVKRPPQVQDTVLYACVNTDNTKSAVFNLSAVNLHVAQGDTSIQVRWYADEELRSLIRDPSAYSSGPGNVFAVATDSLGCQSEVVKVPVLLSPEITVTLNILSVPSCDNPQGGTIRSLIEGGTAPFSYVWSDSTLMGPSADSLTGGLYSLTVIDSTFCRASIEIEVPNPPNFQITCNVLRNVSKVSGMDGLASVQYPRAFNGPATLIISGPINDTIAGGEQLTDSIPNLIAGDYNLTVIDNGGCIASCDFTITEPDCANFFVNTEKRDLLCADSGDGRIAFEVSGSSPVNYDWNDNLLDGLATADNLDAGTYITTITDNQGCAETITTILNEPPQLVLNCSIAQQITQANGSDGQASINIIGGTAPFRLAWTGPSSGSQNVSSNQAVLIDNLMAGTYTFDVLNENGCRDTCRLTFTDIDCSGLQLSLLATNSTCANSDDGTIESQVSGAVGTITYSWSTGATSPHLTNLAPGTYGVTIQDEAGCFLTDNATINEPALLTIDCSNTQSISRAGAEDGQVTIQVGGGTAPYSLVIPSLNDTTILLQTDGSITISNLAVGIYDVLLTDANDCSERCDFTINDIDCNNFTFIPSIREVTCPAGSDGQISIRPQGGQAPYNFDWDDNQFDGQSTITNLAAGTYNVRVRDTIGCVVSRSISVGTENAAPELNISPAQPICADACLELSLNFVGQPPFNLEYKVIAAGFSSDFSLQSQENATSLEICAADFPVNATSIEVLLVKLTDANCSANLSENRLINILAPARTQIDTILCSGQSILINGQVYDEQRPNGQEILINAAQNGCDSIIDINLFYITAPEVVNLETNCNLNNNTFQIQFDLLGLAPFTITGVNGNVFGDAFTSEALAANGVYNLSIQDDFSCSTNIQIEAPDCDRANNCSTTTGTLLAFPTRLCQFEVLSLQTVGDDQLDSNSIRVFALHDGTSTQLGNILLSNQDGNFLFQNPLQIGIDYHTAVLVGRDNGFGVLDRSDPCLAIFLGGAVRFDSAPRKPLFIQGQDTLCVGETLTLSTEKYPDSDLSYNWITPLGDTLITDSNSIQFPNIGPEAAGNYAVFVSNGSCNSPVFMPHQFTTLDFPILYAGEDQVVCGLNQVNLQADPISFGTGEWTNSTNAIIIEPTLDATIARNLVPGVNPFFWTVSANNCVSKDTVLVTYLPTAVAEDDQLSLDPGLTRITFDPFVNDQILGLVLNDTTVQIVSQPELGAVVFLKEDLVFEYTAALGNLEAIAFEYAICSPACQTECDTATVLINLPDVLLDVPDGFIQGRSSDGLRIGNLEAFPDNEIIITNRWGVIVYRARNYSNDQPWKGTHNGADLPQSTYYMYLKIDGRRDVVKKTIHLIVR